MRNPVPAIALLLLVHAAVVLGGVYFMLMAFGQALERELDDQVAVVQRDFERRLDRVVRDVRREIRKSVPPAPPATPPGPPVTPPAPLPAPTP